jgi:hypothetical protein
MTARHIRKDIDGRHSDGSPYTQTHRRVVLVTARRTHTIATVLNIFELSDAPELVIVAKFTRYMLRASQRKMLTTQFGLRRYSNSSSAKIK